MTHSIYKSEKIGKSTSYGKYRVGQEVMVQGRKAVINYEFLSPNWWQGVTYNVRYTGDDGYCIRVQEKEISA